MATSRRALAGRNPRNLLNRPYARPAFLSRARALMVRGTHLAHRSPFQLFERTIRRYESRGITAARARDILSTIAGNREPQARAMIAQLVARPPTRQVLKQLLSQLNSMPHNLRPGDPSRNQAIQGRLDPNVQLSRGRPVQRGLGTARTRSPTPESRRQIVGLLRAGESVRFYAPSQRLVSSGAVESIAPNDMLSSVLEAGAPMSTTWRFEGNEAVFEA